MTRVWLSKHGLAGCRAHGHRPGEVYISGPHSLHRLRGHRDMVLHVVGDYPDWFRSEDFALLIPRGVTTAVRFHNPEWARENPCSTCQGDTDGEG